MTGRRKQPPTPQEYIRSACELHLNATLDDNDDEKQDDNKNNKVIVEEFLDNEKSDRLFVWIDRKDETVQLSTERMDGVNLGALCFIKYSSSSKSLASPPLQCITLCPRIYEEEAAAAGEAGETKERESQQQEGAGGNSSNTFLSLQLYARHVFVPAVQAAVPDSSLRLDGLQDKIRELDVALGQYRRSSQIPPLSLQTHPLLGTAQQPSATDDAFLNELQSGVSQWIAQIRKITILPTTTPFPSILQESSADMEEITFWASLQEALKNVEKELLKPEVQQTLQILKDAKRFVATIALENNTGLDTALAHATDVNSFLANYPLPQLEAARDMDKLATAMNAIFDYIPKVRSSRHYDLDRLCSLVEATTLSLSKRMQAILHEAYPNTMLLTMPFDKYEQEVRYPTQDVLVQVDDHYVQFTEFILDQGRRRRLPSGKTATQLLQKLKLHHTLLAERLEAIWEWRNSHEKLCKVVSEALVDSAADSKQNLEATRQLEAAPLVFGNVQDVLDNTTVGGKAAMETALESYDRKVDVLEERLAKLLRDKLTSCQDAEDMFRVFARFNPLLTRTRVRDAVKEFQMQLISTVGVAVEKLQSKFTEKYESSKAAQMSKLRGIPPVAGKIMWARQMERQVHALMKRMGDVLGPDWGQQLEGRQLKRSGEELLAKLDPRAYFRSWVKEWERELTSATNTRVASYPILIYQEGDGTLVAKVNFEEKNELLFREIRYLKWLGFDKDIPRTLLLVSDEAVTRYAHATAIKTALRSYSAVRELITPELEPLIMPQLVAVRECIAEAFDVSLDNRSRSGGGSKPIAKRRVRWETPEMAEWVAKLTNVVTQFEERVEQLLRACDKVDIALNLLESVTFDGLYFKNVLNSIQKAIDEMSLAGYADLSQWVAVVDERMGVVLSKRLESALEDWGQSFMAASTSTEGEDGGEEKKEDTPKSHSSATVKIPTIAVEILLRNQEISAFPAVQTVRSLFLDELHDYMGIVCNLSRPTSGRFEVFDNRTGTAVVEGDEEKPQTFGHLVETVSSDVLTKAYMSIESHIAKLEQFVSQWLSYQILWDTNVADVAGSLGDDMDKWQSLLLEAVEARSALDATASVAEFGPIAVSYVKVQNQVNLKYDSWQKQLQTSFADILGNHIHECHEKIVNAKTQLENTSLETTAATNELVLGVTYLQEMKQKLPLWEKEVAKLMDSERLLKRQRHKFRGDWVESSRLKGQFEHLEQILERRSRTMDDQVPVLQARVVAEDKASTQRVAELTKNWQDERPLRGNIKPQVARDTLSKFEFALKKAHLDFENLIKAKDALGLEHAFSDSEVSESLDELADLKEVWEAVAKPHDQLEEIKDTPWATAVTRKIRKGLDDLLADLRSLPNRIRQYDPYIHLHDTVKGLLSGQSMLTDLKTDALKDRHWKTILQRLGIRVPFSELTVGLLWDNGVLTRKKEMHEILAVAQGEMALEVFLGQVRDRWMKQELELVLYQNRVRLIRGWDDLFATLDDHMGGLILMRGSPYYRSVREFQEEGKLWEDRLTKLRGSFDAWIDVQRRWVYLEGILFGSSDIKAQLPAEWSRFKSVDGEFVALMRRISSRPFAMEALNIENLQRTLERLGNLMVIIQRALGEYLDKQRRDFSRFYFLGDDDLLEIIGNASEPGKVMPHVSKMFAGIASARAVKDVELPEGVIKRFDAMVSKDGEVVPLDSVIDVTAQTSVKEWLKQLESGMHTTLAKLLNEAVNDDSSASLSTGDEASMAAFVEWATKYPAQIMILATQINWSMSVETALCKGEEGSHDALAKVVNGVESKLKIMAETVLKDLPSESRKKFEQMITELVHHRDVTRGLMEGGVCSPTDFRWLYHLRFNYNPNAAKLDEKLQISLSNAKFYYGFEYLGIGERLVQTPLTDKCYLSLTQALHFGMGGNPFGPAGTGKTESVKALGAQLGRFVLVMNCDETFDFGAMGRLFCGLCQVGAWGCFDEFNRLEERILSAVSQQILTIQRGLLEKQSNIELLKKTIKLHENVGIFVTMNPGYAGRSNLPDNLKTLFRSVAMEVPDRYLIAQVMLYSQGIVTAEQLAGKVVDLFMLCESRMSKQSHYDFGLRALKTLLVSAGGLKRKALEGSPELKGEELAKVEKSVLIEGACNNVVPKLVAEDLELFSTFLEDIFPGSTVAKMEYPSLKKEIVEICKARNLVVGENWMQKVLQLNQVLGTRHGVMLVGPVGVGKSAALSVLLEGLEKVEKVKGEMYVIDPKAMNKDSLYGTLDGTTMEWTDGVFTSLLRTILANQRGEADRRHWIVFDGDVDPEWAENLNSALDDNKLLTLPSGERLGIPDNIRIILEVDSLAHATPATVSRCGMVWFSNDVINSEMCLVNLMGRLRSTPLMAETSGGEIPAAQIGFLDEIQPLVVSDGRSTSLVHDALEFALAEPHVMPPTRERLLQTLKALLINGIEHAIEYDENHPDFPMAGEHLTNFAKRWLLHSLLWSFAGSSSWEVRKKFGDMLLRTSGLMLPNADCDLADYRVRPDTGEYEPWSDSVPRMEIESHKVTATDVVITTTDTVRHSEVLGAWLASRMPLVLCGPPGSGKTMTLTSVLQSVKGVVLASLNFSSRTTPEIILKTFTQYCNYVRRGKDIVLEPVESLGSDSWLVIFCDEINLPEEDSYGTQRVIMFMRQLVESGGFWRHDNIWVKINRIQFVGACNPPTDAGRVQMSPRFLRHAPLLFVDFPAKSSLLQIYGTFNTAMMKLFPNLKGETEALTESMVELYTENQTKFTPETQPQYFYSPRELSRWVRGIYEAVVHLDQGLTREELVRIWAHEALRLFSDRLVEESEREWCDEKIDEIAKKWFAGVDFEEALARPVFYSTWLSKDTKRVERTELKDFLSARLRVFYEEELDVPLVVFDEVLEHILRIDRVLRQPMGHCLLVGDSGAGKTVLSKFVSWMNGLSIFQIKAHSRYGIEDFNEDLRAIMRRVGVEGEKVCFIFDEGNVLGSGFLEAMNALLASGEVPGLFEGDEYVALMHAARDSAARDGVIVDSDDELWRRFTSIVQRNLHVVFTMNPGGGEWKNRSTTSPALFNRCVVDWFGTWGRKAMGEVGKEFTGRLDMGDAESIGGTWGFGDGEVLMKQVEDAFGEDARGGLRQAVVAALSEFHNIVKAMAEELAHSATSTSRTYLSPRDYLALIQNFVSCLTKRREEVEDEQLHVNAGLSKLRQTQENVADLKTALSVKKGELREKETLANNKLQQMVADQNVAEKRKEEAERISIEVQKQDVEITKRKEEAQRDLDEAEPALKSAQASVRSIKKRDLDEVRNLARPPPNVVKTLQVVAIMMGEKSTEWADVRKMLSKSDFIPSILHFDVDKLSQKQIKVVEDKYMSSADLTVESVTRSSKACGPLYKWAVSQVRYSNVYNRVQPLRDEVAQLEKESQQVKDEKAKIDAEVSKLETSIAQYKADYALLIRDVEALKTEMESVITKVDRAEALISSLSQESERWSKSSEIFEAILRSLVGDGLLMAAFLTYAGFFDFRTRLVLLKKWRNALDLLGIEFREDLSMIESLSKASDRLHWQAEGLPSDSLSLENGVILDHCVRFPLVIDPSGHAIDFLMQKFKDQKIQRTSFLDKAFMKTLAGAVRFGTALLVENVETIDPVLNPILNREIQRTGGRSLVRIGTEDVDYSPKFSIILSTKNPAARLTPDLCSRVTLVNFTVTPASLQSQSLSLVLKTEKPEVEEQRVNILKLQGEQNVKLRELEEQMLAKISACEGSILDDDRVVDGMEVLMKEGAQVEEQISKSAEVMKEVQRAIGEFDPLAIMCRKLFVLLCAMREISFLYEFSAKTFMSILKDVLGFEGAKGVDDAQRMGNIKKLLFREVAARAARGLSSEDKLVFTLLLGRIYKSDDAFPTVGTSSVEDITSLLETEFGASFPWQGRGLNFLKAVTEKELDAFTPLMLCSARGYDVSGRVEAMARQEHKELSSVAMGSAEGFVTAETLLAAALKRGTWVMLKNVHLCIEWIQDTLVKKLQTLGSGTHPDFRIFITSEISPKLPTSLLRLSDIIIAEAPSGLSASISRFFTSIAEDRLSYPVRNRLYLVLAWIHAVIQERLRFIPVGWSEQYELTEADATHALDVIDALVENATGGKQNVDPEKLPWDAIQETLCKGVFGGRITKETDLAVLNDLVKHTMVPSCFDVNFQLVRNVPDGPCLPDGTSKEECLTWIDELPKTSPPTWVNLSHDAETARSKAIAESVMDKVARVADAQIDK